MPSSVTVRSPDRYVARLPVEAHKLEEASIPRQNRVTPFGDIVTLPDRGLLMGNRGILHDDAQHIVRSWQVRRWIACRTAFRGRHRQVMQPHSWTELFFLDEATAFAAGHRPCAECRHADYQRFKAAWAAAFGGPTASAEQMDAVLHADRLEGRGRRQSYRKRTYYERLAALPDGTFITLDDDHDNRDNHDNYDNHDDGSGSAWLLWHGQLLAWSPAGYLTRQPLPLPPRPPDPPAATSRIEGVELVTVLTPRSLVAVLRAGYRPMVHPSADGRT